MSEGESPAEEEPGFAPSSLPSRAEIQQRLRRYASLRYAERALSPSVAPLRENRWQTRGQRLRQRLEELTRAWNKLGATERPDPDAAEAAQKEFVGIGVELSAIADELRRYADDVQPPQPPCSPPSPAPPPFLAPARGRLVAGSILDPAALAKAVAGAQVIFHFAALTSVAESVERPEDYLNVNDTGTLRVLEAARAAAAPGHRVVYAASSSVYGDRGEIEIGRAHV